MLIILIDRWQVLSYLIRLPLLNQANHAIWQKSWFASVVLAVFPWSLKVNAYKEEKRACPFSSSPRRQKKTTKSFCRQRVGFEISRERQGLLLQSRKWLKDDKAPEKPIEATAESSFTNSLARGASFLGREAAKRETKSREVSRHIKIGWSTVLKVYCSGKEASRKTPGSGLLSIFPGKCPTFKKCIEWK